MFAEEREHFTDRHAAAARGIKFEGRGETGAADLLGKRLVVEPGQLGLGVPGVDVRWRAGCEDMDDALRAAGEVRLARRERRMGIDDIGAGGVGRGQKAHAHEAGEAERAKAKTDAVQELAAGEEKVFQAILTIAAGAFDHGNAGG